MPKKIVISHFNNTAAIIYKNKIQEIFSINSNYQVNDIYLGSVNKIFESINAAFINLGVNKQSGFIHIHDIKFIKKKYRLNQITDIVSLNQLLIVQVVKEPTLNKGPRLTTNINLFGRYLVLMPFCNTVNISHKIYDKNERSYLYAIAILLKPSNMGLLVRSSATGINEAALVEDLSLLKKQWIFIQKLAILNCSPSLLYKDEDLVKKIIRDLYNKKIYSILTDSSKVLDRARYYLNRWHCIAPNNKIGLKLFKYSDSIFDHFNINSALINALNPKVNLSVGGYLFIETYEALTIIDVNSGSFSQANNSKETVLRTNCYAAIEIAYQMKLRNINGIIIVDFIDMESYRDQIQLLEHFARVLSIDNAKPQIIQMSKLGLVELTRKRREQSLLELFHTQYINSLVVHSDYTSLTKLYKDCSINQVHKKIKALFFGIFFHRLIYLYSILFYDPNQYEAIEMRGICFYSANYLFIVPVALHSKIIYSLFKYR